MAPDQELAQVLAGRLLGQHAALDQHVPHFRGARRAAAMAGSGRAGEQDLLPVHYPPASDCAAHRGSLER